MRKYLVITSIVLGALLLLCVIGSILFMNRGVLIVVRNTGANQMFDVQAELGGKKIRLGDIATGDSASGRAVPGADSDILITFTDELRTPHSIQLDIYITGGYSGRVEAEIRDGALVSKSDGLDVAWY